MKRIVTPQLSTPAFPPSIGIPKVLSQVFLAGCNAIPAELRDRHIPSLCERNPGWEYQMFDAVAAEAFIRTNYGADMLGVYNSIDPIYYAARGDLFRYLLIYAQGGVYLDVKSDVIRPLDSLIRSDDEFILSQWPTDKKHRHGGAGKHIELAHILGGEYQQWFIIATRGHPFLRAVIERVVGNLVSYRPFHDGVGAHGVLRSTGPIAYTLAIHPIVSDHRHRFIQSLDDDMLAYTIFSDTIGHKGARHYAYLCHPLVSRHPFADFVARVYFTAKRMTHRLGVRLRAFWIRSLETTRNRNS